MSERQTITFSTSDSYDSDKISLSSGEISLKLRDLTSQTSSQDFSSDTDFTYDSDKTEFSGGKCQQKDTRPSNATFAATFTTDEDGVWGDGTLTGTLNGSTTIDSGWCKHSNTLGDGLHWSGTSNADSAQVGAYKMIIQPKYSGSPAGAQVFISANKTNLLESATSLVHSTAGNLRLSAADEDGVSYSADFGAWSPTAGTDYEIELNYDYTSGATRVFVDGNQVGSTITSTFTRDSSEIADFFTGDGITADQTPNFWIKDIVIFSAVQHTSNYTPGYTLNETIYLEDLVTLPDLDYSGLGSIQEYTAFSTTQTGVQRFNVNGKYWDGAAWSTSDDSLAQMNTVADVNTNIDTLTAADTISIKMRWSATNTLQDIDLLTVTYTGQNYGTDNDSLDTATSVNMKSLDGFFETATKPSGTEIKYCFKIGSTFKYYDGSAEAVSDGTYSQANTASDIDTYHTAFSFTQATNLRIFLHSDDGSVTPTL